MRKIKYIIGSCVLLIFIGFNISVTAQTTTSTIEGTVRDANGAVVAGEIGRAHV